MKPLPEIHQATKFLGPLVTPVWAEGLNGDLVLVVTLEDTLGITMEGMYLRGRAVKDRPDEEVMLQLEYPHDHNRRHSAIDRIDWNPLRGHNNKGRGPKHLRFVFQRGTHRHSFDLNWLEDEQRMLSGNLPIAEPISYSLPGFVELLEFCGKCFNIEGLSDLPPPPWERTLL